MSKDNIAIIFSKKQPKPVLCGVLGAEDEGTKIQ
jgi:hypothetical protein